MPYSARWKNVPDFFFFFPNVMVKTKKALSQMQSPEIPQEKPIGQRSEPQAQVLPAQVRRRGPGRATVNVD